MKGWNAGKVTVRAALKMKFMYSYPHILRWQMLKTWACVKHAVFLPIFLFIHPNLAKFLDFPQYTVNSTFMTAFICAFCITENLGLYILNRLFFYLSQTYCSVNFSCSCFRGASRAQKLKSPILETAVLAVRSFFGLTALSVPSNLSCLKEQHSVELW